jgi:hypothetical protein
MFEYSDTAGVDSVEFFSKHEEINHQNQTSVDILIKMESAIGNMQVNCFSSIPWVTPSPLSDLQQQHLQQTEDAIVSKLLHTKNMPCHFTTIT